MKEEKAVKLSCGDKTIQIYRAPQAAPLVIYHAVMGEGKKLWQDCQKIGCPVIPLPGCSPSTRLTKRTVFPALSPPPVHFGIRTFFHLCGRTGFQKQSGRYISRWGIRRATRKIPISPLWRTTRAS